MNSNSPIAMVDCGDGSVGAGHNASAPRSDGRLLARLSLAGSSSGPLDGFRRRHAKASKDARSVCGLWVSERWLILLRRIVLRRCASNIAPCLLPFGFGGAFGGPKLCAIILGALQLFNLPFPLLSRLFLLLLLLTPVVFLGFPQKLLLSLGGSFIFLRPPRAFSLNGFFLPCPQIVLCSARGVGSLLGRSAADISGPGRCCRQADE